LDDGRRALALASDVLGWLTKRTIGNRSRRRKLNSMRLAIFNQPQQLRDRLVGMARETSFIASVDLLSVLSKPR
jgi:hypothetical protein